MTGRPHRTTLDYHVPGLADLPLDSLEADLPGLRDAQEVPDHGADVDGGEDAVGDHGAEAGHHDREQERHHHVRQPQDHHREAVGRAADGVGEDLREPHPHHGAGPGLHAQHEHHDHEHHE